MCSCSPKPRFSRLLGRDSIAKDSRRWPANCHFPFQMKLPRYIRGTTAQGLIRAYPSFSPEHGSFHLQLSVLPTNNRVQLPEKRPSTRTLLPNNSTIHDGCLSLYGNTECEFS